MKILMLGNSGDSGSDASGNLRNKRLAELLTEGIGQPVDITPRQVWPNHRMPAYVERLISETTPDLVYFHIVDYAIAYPSTPVRLRRYGPVGRWLASRSLLFADNRKLSHNRPTRALRYLVQATIGGDPHVPVDEGIKAYVDAIRIAARYEDAIVIVAGPLGIERWGTTARQHRTAESARYLIHAALRDTCATLHIPHIGSETPVWADPTHARFRGKDEHAGDGLHENDHGAELSARRHAADLLAAYREHLATHG